MKPLHDSPSSSHATPDVDDERLLAGLLANDARAWRQFQKDYDRLIARRVSSVTRSFGSSLSSDDALEIRARVYLCLLNDDKRKLRSFDPARGHRFSSWIGLMTTHCAYDYLRAIRRLPERATIDEAAEVECELPDPAERSARRQEADMVASVLAGFSDTDRAFASLYFGENLAPKVIATRMKISVKTVYSKRHKIQLRLENALGLRIAA